MNCEKCGSGHDGLYGSGRFCSSSCSRSFSTSKKRSEINDKVSRKLTGRSNPGGGFKKGFDSNRKVFSRNELLANCAKARKMRKSKYPRMTWSQLPMAEKRRRVLAEQTGACLCGINSWLGNPLTLELDHINGVRTDNRRENLRVLCPNCHSQTPTYRRKKKD